MYLAKMAQVLLPDTRWLVGWLSQRHVLPAIGRLLIESDSNDMSLGEKCLVKSSPPPGHQPGVYFQTIRYINQITFFSLASVAPSRTSGKCQLASLSQSVTHCVVRWFEL